MELYTSGGPEARYTSVGGPEARYTSGGGPEARYTSAGGPEDLYTSAGGPEALYTSVGGPEAPAIKFCKTRIMKNIQNCLGIKISVVYSLKVLIVQISCHVSDLCIKKRHYMNTL